MKKHLNTLNRQTSTVKLAKHQEELTYLWGQILYKTGKLEEAAEKFTELIENFPNSRFVEEAQEIIEHINNNCKARKRKEQKM